MPVKDSDTSINPDDIIIPESDLAAYNDFLNVLSESENGSEATQTNYQQISDYGYTDTSEH